MMKAGAALHTTAWGRAL